MRVLFIAEGANGCALYRVEQPAKYLPRHGVDVKIVGIHCTDEDLKWADIIVVQKQFELGFYYRMEQWKKAGKRIVYEVDDDVFNIPTWNPAHAFYQRVKTNIEKYLRLADAVTCSTDFLARRITKINPRTFVLPNSIDIEDLDNRGPNPEVVSPLDKKCRHISYDQYRQRCQGKIVIGWLGSPTHKKDLQVLVPVLKRIVRQYRDRVMIVMGGCVHRETAHRTPYKNMMFLEMVPARVYPRYLASLGFDIGLAPVYDHIFNYSKSNLKVIEYMACGYVPVASNLITYNTTIQNDFNGILCGRPQDWMNNLRTLIDHPDRLERIRYSGREFVRSRYNMASTVTRWVDAYNHIYQGR